MRIPIRSQHPEPRKISRAVETLAQGGVIAYPTDTVYGLGCVFDDKKAIDRVYRMKEMRPDQPLAFLCPDLSDIARYAVVDNHTYRILKRATPGPVTFILAATRDVPKRMMLKRKQVGIRVPDHDVPQAILRELGKPIVSTSASYRGQVLNDPEEIDARFAQLDLVLDAGWGGVEPSTVIDVTGDEPHVIREGLGNVESFLR